MRAGTRTWTEFVELLDRRRRRRRRRARGRHSASRHQAGEHPADEERLREARGLRSRKMDESPSIAAGAATETPHPRRRHRRHRRLHVARTGDRPRCRREQRRLLVRDRVVRNARAAAAFRRPHGARCPARDRESIAPAAAGVDARAAPRARRSRAAQRSGDAHTMREFVRELRRLVRHERRRVGDADAQSSQCSGMGGPRIALAIPRRGRSLQAAGTIASRCHSIRSNHQLCRLRGFAGAVT